MKQQRGGRKAKQLQRACSPRSIEARREETELSGKNVDGLGISWELLSFGFLALRAGPSRKSEAGVAAKTWIFGWRARP